MAKPAEQPQKKSDATSTLTGSNQLASERASQELIFGIVGHVGSGTSTAAENLKSVLNNTVRNGLRFQTEIVKARSVIEEWASASGESFPTRPPLKIEDVERLQDLGDMLRERTTDHAGVARGVVKKIRLARAKLQGVTAEPNSPVIPDGSPRAYIIDSIKHPAEVQLLRHIYGDAFVLVGVVCEENIRKQRISEKYRDAGLEAAERFMARDAKAQEKHGQRVSDAFHLSDFFLNNSAPRFLDGNPSKPNSHWAIADDLTRLIKLVSHQDIERPHIEETAMYKAAGAAMRSACLSRQVGAAILDSRGNIIATGANEVPSAGGGVYGESFEHGDHAHLHTDDRCFRSRRICSNTVEQNHIARAILDDLGLSADPNASKLVKRLKSGRIGELLEFSRAVHAEMDAILSAGRQGASTIGCRLYVTTFPCHYCARHIVSAGIDEVQYIEPYPKSKAFSLHDDSIQNDVTDHSWKPPSQGGTKVLFRPYTGVAPRMYRRAFLKNRDLKDRLTGEVRIAMPEWGSPYDIAKTSYAEFEVTLTNGL